ncbi:MAG TPA: methylmalonyl Co-A mutase-associated GTPase MeaB [Chryseolinea sp.]|nr:methylmalonyl Co-A mutase-associated GTPase MeaB [Chryseolinea sp.]
MQTVKPRLHSDQYATGILSGDRVMLGQAITLIESNIENDKVLSAELLEKLMPHTGNSLRLGITGAPGVGKSTFIEAFGKYVTDQGKKIAVLTIDPSSQITKGSILGDKTRMEELSKNPMAFIRPTASGNILGGVSNKTREVLLLCEASGYSVIIIETVGVGQTEVNVKHMVDFFLLLMLAGAGDELQGIKKGIMEMTDAMVITKADGDNMDHATRAQAEYQHALHLFPASASGWQPRVITASSLTGKGIDAVWKMIIEYQNLTTTSGFLKQNRSAQQVAWLNEYFDQLLKSDFHRLQNFQSTLKNMERDVAEQKLSAYAAAQILLKALYENLKSVIG